MQGLCLKQTQLLTQSHTLSLEQVQQISISVGLLRRRVTSDGGSNPGNPKDILERILGMVINAADNPGIRPALEAFFADQTFRERILSERDVLAVVTSQKLTDFCVELVFYASTVSNVFVRAMDERGNIQVDPPKTTLVKFSSAYRDAKAFDAQIEAFNRIAKANGVTDGAMLELRELQDARLVVQTLCPHIDSLALLLTYAFTRRTTEGSLLGNFLRDAAILDRLDLILSEQLLKRFAKRWEKIGRRGTAVDFETAILNTVGEYTLMSMGIIQPTIFTRQRGELSDVHEHAIAALEKIGIPARQLLSRYNLKESGRIFWYRYHLKNTASDRVADIQIREFLTEILRNDRLAILEALGYEDFFHELKAVDFEDPEEYRVELTRILGNVLGSDSFQDHFLILLRKWYVTFEKFL
jgi:hypothetical protein